MSKIFSYYSKNKDGIDTEYCWYDSSNVKYTECLDPDNELKTLKVVFSNGAQYVYKKVDLKDYMLFRENVSQGKALNESIKSKGYEYEKLENGDLATLDGELSFRMNGGVFVYYDGSILKMLDNKDAVIFEKEAKLDKDTLNTVCGVLAAVGKDVKLITTKEFDNGETRQD